MVFPTRRPTTFLSSGALSCTFLLAGMAIPQAAVAAPRDQANLIFNRLNGVPPTSATLDALTTKVTNGDVKGAALDSINDAGGNFYNLTLKDLVSRWTNTDKTPRVDLNDYTATVLGMTRDDVPFNTALAADMVYVIDSTKVAGVPAYSLANNDMYTFAGTTTANLKTALLQQKQSALTPALTTDATAGVMTTRGFAEAYFKDGTNRRAVAFTLDTFLCNDLTHLADTTRPDVRVRRDVTRAPGGDSTLFRNQCVGCHAGMDAFGGAFAYYDVTDGATANADAFVYTAGTVAPKMNRNAQEFPDGYVTTDDSWFNNWNVGQNAALGWNGAQSGNGAKALGTMLGDSDAFASCMATRAVTAMCLHAPATKIEQDAVATIAADFKKDWSLKNVFAEAAVTCSGE